MIRLLGTDLSDRALYIHGLLDPGFGNHTKTGGKHDHEYLPPFGQATSRPEDAIIATVYWVMESA